MTGPARDCASLGELDVLPIDVLITPDGKQLIVRGVAYDEGNPVMGLVSLALDAGWRADAHRLRRQGCSGL